MAPRRRRRNSPSRRRPKRSVLQRYERLRERQFRSLPGSSICIRSIGSCMFWFPFLVGASGVWKRSSIGQSVGLISRWFQVRILAFPPTERSKLNARLGVAPDNERHHTESSRSNSPDMTEELAALRTRSQAAAQELERYVNRHAGDARTQRSNQLPRRV